MHDNRFKRKLDRRLEPARKEAKDVQKTAARMNKELNRLREQ
jgi:hypothetical protein